MSGKRDDGSSDQSVSERQKKNWRSEGHEEYGAGDVDQRRASHLSSTSITSTWNGCQTRNSGKSKFVSRPGMGSKGKQILLISNHFLLKIEDISCYHYDIDIQLIRGNGSQPMMASCLGSGDGKKLTQSINRSVIEELVKEWTEVFKDVKPVYDGSKNLYTSKEIKILGLNKEKSMTKVIDVYLENNKQSYNVQMKFARQIEFSAINAYYSGHLDEFPKEAIQALDIILRHCPTMNRIPIGNSLYTPWKPNLRTSIGDNREVAFGHYQSVRYTSSGPTLVIDRTATAFHTGGSVIDFVRNMIDLNGDSKRGPNQQPLRPTHEDLVGYHLNRKDFSNINRELKGLQVSSSHLKYKRKYKVLAITERSADKEKFDWDTGSGVRETTVAQFFEKQYNIKLQFPHLPCLNVGTPRKAVHLPLEVCQLVPDQHVKKKITPLQTASMIKLSSSQNPFQRFEVISKSVADVIDDSDKHLKEFKISLDDKPLLVSARVLDPPDLQYVRNNNLEILTVNEGKWDLKNKGVFRPVELQNWALVVMAQQMYENKSNQLKPEAKESLDKFVLDLIAEATKIGMSVKPTKLRLCRPYTPQNVENVINEVLKKVSDLQLIMFVSNENDRMYNEIKYTGDVRLGVTTQCIHQKNVWKNNSSLLANLLLKVNAKIGGINAKINENLFSDKPDLLKSSTMIIAADITHPAPADQLTSSVAAVVGSYDSNYCKYSSCVRVQQKSDGEMIKEFDIMLIEILNEYQRANEHHLPNKIIYYRDGVSEGQFDSVLEHEHKKMLEAFRGFRNYSPKVTFVIVQKRHHTRFRVKDRMEGVGKAQNIPPGTTVDQTVCHPTDFDFYLCSHAGLQGTSRPTHYVVLHDDNNFSADQLQRVSFFLCHTYARCSRSISIPAPVQYAHLAAFRSRHHIIASKDYSQNNVKLINKDIQISGKHKTQLYYC